MAMTTVPRDLQNPATEAPTMEPPTGRPGLLGWLVVAVALVASTVLAALVLTGGGDATAPAPWYSVERGSIAAIDHAAEAAEIASRPSIAAADHNAAPTAQTPADASAERGSIAALDHAADEQAAEDDATGAG